MAQSVSRSLMSSPYFRRLSVTLTLAWTFCLDIQILQALVAGKNTQFFIISKLFYDATYNNMSRFKTNS